MPLLTWFLALSPVLVVLILMLVFGWGGSRAGAAAWIAAVSVGFAFFGLTLRVLAVAQMRAVLLSLDVLYIIWMALLFFHVADEAGAVEIIGKRLPSLTADPVMQSLILSWVFVSFLQGMGGFGVPVAVVAPLMMGLGFTATKSVVMASIGHGWAVTFGSLGTSFAALMSVTALSDSFLAPQAALLLGGACFICGGIVAYLAGGWRGMLHGIPAVVILAGIMASVQYVLATNGLWNLGSTGAGLVGIGAALVIARIPLYQTTPADQPEGDNRTLWIALAGYAVLIGLIMTFNLVEPISVFVNRVQLSVMMPTVETSMGWVNEGGLGRTISVFGHPGAVLLYSSLVAYGIYRYFGLYTEGARRRIGQKVLNSAVKSSLGILAMVGMATIMGHAGMTNVIAQGLSDTISAGLYPGAAPFIGALGAFMTGSNTNSNVVFGLLQKETAELLGLSVSLILGAQTTGAALGSVLAPAKVIVGASTVGLAGEEGPVIRQMLLLGIIPIVIIALLVWVLGGG